MKIMSMICLVALTISFSTSVFGATTLRYYNKDSKSYTFDVKTCGNSTKVTFGSSRTASVTIQGCDKATIKTKCGSQEVKTGQKIEIKNGCIK